MPTMQVNDLTMYYELHGDGPVLVLINGFGADISMIGGLIRSLSQHFTVIAFDNRGAGRTDKPDIPYTIPMMAEDTAGLMSSLKLGPTVVLGVSMGGRIAMTLACEHPDLVSRLILASTAARRHRSLPEQASNLLSFLPHLRGRYPQPPHAYRRQIMAAEDFDFTDRLPEISTPTLILHGRRDRVIPIELAEEVHAGIRGSRLIVFKGGHLFMFRREREAFLQEVTEFLGA